MNQPARSALPTLPPTGQAPTEPTPRERVARARSLAKRALVYWKMALFIFVVGSGFATMAALNVKRIYRSECVVLFKPALKTSDDDSPTERASKIAPKLKEVLTTRARLEGIIQAFSLYPGLVDARGMLEAVEEMRTHIGFRGRDSETFVFSFESDSPELAQKVTQRLADTTIAEFAKSSVGAAREQTDFLSAEEKRSEQNLENASKALAKFLAAHPEFAFALSTNGTGPFGSNPNAGMPVMPGLPGPQSSSDPQLAALYRQRARLEAEKRGGGAVAGSVPLGIPTPGGVAQAETISRLTAIRDEAAKVAAQSQADLADKRTRLTDEHPDMIAARTTAESAARQLHLAEVQLAAVQAAAAGPSAGVDNALGATADLQKKLDTVGAQIAARQVAIKQNKTAAGGTEKVDASVPEPANELVELETESQRLVRAVRDAKSEHDDLTRRLERARLQFNATEATGGDRMQMLDPAYLPLRPSGGSRSKTGIAGGFVALILALVYAFARVLLNDTVIDAADIEALELIPVLGTLPKIPSSSSQSMIKEGSSGGV